MTDRNAIAQFGKYLGWVHILVFPASYPIGLNKVAHCAMKHIQRNKSIYKHFKCTFYPFYAYYLSLMIANKFHTEFYCWFYIHFPFNKTNNINYIRPTATFITFIHWNELYFKEWNIVFIDNHFFFKKIFNLINYFFHSLFLKAQYLKICIYYTEFIENIFYFR